MTSSPPSLDVFDRMVRLVPRGPHCGHLRDSKSTTGIAPPHWLELGGKSRRLIGRSQQHPHLSKKTTAPMWNLFIYELDSSKIDNHAVSCAIVDSASAFLTGTSARVTRLLPSPHRVVCRDCHFDRRRSSSSQKTPMPSALRRHASRTPTVP